MGLGNFFYLVIKNIMKDIYIKIISLMLTIACLGAPMPVLAYAEEPLCLRPAAFTERGRPDAVTIFKAHDWKVDAVIDDFCRQEGRPLKNNEYPDPIPFFAERGLLPAFRQKFLEENEEYKGVGNRLGDFFGISGKRAFKLKTMLVPPPGIKPSQAEIEAILEGHHWDLHAAEPELRRYARGQFAFDILQNLGYIQVVYRKVWQVWVENDYDVDKTADRFGFGHMQTAPRRATVRRYLSQALPLIAAENGKTVPALLEETVRNIFVKFNWKLPQVERPLNALSRGRSVFETLEYINATSVLRDEYIRVYRENLGLREKVAGYFDVSTTFVIELNRQLLPIDERTRQALDETGWKIGEACRRLGIRPASDIIGMVMRWGLYDEFRLYAIDVFVGCQYNAHKAALALDISELQATQLIDELALRRGQEQRHTPLIALPLEQVRSICVTNGWDLNAVDKALEPYVQAPGCLNKLIALSAEWVFINEALRIAEETNYNFAAMARHFNLHSKTLQEDYLKRLNLIDLIQQERAAYEVRRKSPHVEALTTEYVLRVSQEKDWQLSAIEKVLSKSTSIKGIVGQFKVAGAVHILEGKILEVLKAEKYNYNVAAFRLGLPSAAKLVLIIEELDLQRRIDGQLRAEFPPDKALEICEKCNWNIPEIDRELLTMIAIPDFEEKLKMLGIEEHLRSELISTLAKEHGNIRATAEHFMVRTNVMKGYIRRFGLTEHAAEQRKNRPTRLQKAQRKTQQWLYRNRNDVLTALFNNIREPYNPLENDNPKDIERILKHPSNSRAALEIINPRLLKAAEQYRFNILPGASGPVLDPVAAYYRNLFVDPVINESEALELRKAIVSGDKTAGHILAERLATLVPVIVMQIQRAGYMPELRKAIMSDDELEQSALIKRINTILPPVQTQHSDYINTGVYTEVLIDRANLSLMKCLDSGIVNEWNSESGPFLDFIRSAAILDMLRVNVPEGPTPWAPSLDELVRSRKWKSRPSTKAAALPDTANQARIAQRQPERIRPQADEFTLEEKRKFAAALTEYLRKCDLEALLKECNINQCAIYIFLSLGSQYDGYKDYSNLNLLALTDGRYDQNVYFLAKLRSLLVGTIGELQQGNDELVNAPAILIGMKRDYKMAIRYPSDFINLLLRHRIGSPQKGLAIIEAHSVNGYQPNFDVTRRRAITKRIARIAYQATNDEIVIAGMRYPTTRNAICVYERFPDCAEILERSLRQELREIEVFERQNTAAGTRVRTMDDYISSARAELEQRTFQNQFAAQQRMLNGSIVRPVAFGERSRADGVAIFESKGWKVRAVMAYLAEQEGIVISSREPIIPFLSLRGLLPVFKEKFLEKNHEFMGISKRLAGFFGIDIQTALSLKAQFVSPPSIETLERLCEKEAKWGAAAILGLLGEYDTSNKKDLLGRLEATGALDIFVKKFCLVVVKSNGDLDGIAGAFTTTRDRVKEWLSDQRIKLAMARIPSDEFAKMQGVKLLSDLRAASERQQELPKPADIIAPPGTNIPDEQTLAQRTRELQQHVFELIRQQIAKETKARISKHRYNRYKDVLAALYANAGVPFDPLKTHKSDEVNMVLQHFLNHQSALEAINPRLLKAAERYRLKILPGASGPLLDPVAAYYRDLSTDPVITEAEALELRNAILSGDNAANALLAQRLVTLIPNIVMYIQRRDKLVQNRYTENLISRANFSLVQCLALGMAKEWGPESGIFLDFISRCVIAKMYPHWKVPQVQLEQREPQFVAQQRLLNEAV